MLNSLLGVVSLLLYIMIFVIIAQAVLSWLVAFNVINTYNEFVRQFLDFLDRMTEPLYRPIRRIMPDLGGIDFSPIVVILVFQLLIQLIGQLQRQLMTGA